MALRPSAPSLTPIPFAFSERGRGGDQPPARTTPAEAGAFHTTLRGEHLSDRWSGFCARKTSALFGGIREF
jgi:hypothetical protein